MFMTGARLKLLGGAVLTLLILTTFCGTVPATTLAAAPAATNDWQDTGLTLPAAFSSNLASLNFCFDATYPGLLYVNGSSGGAIAYDWQNNNQILQFAYNFTLCDERTGQLYGPQGSGAVRFNLNHPQGQYIQYMPDVLAQDGTGVAYAITRDANHSTFDDNRLYFSPDNGQTWIDRGLPFRGKRIASVTVVPAYAGAIYASVLEKPTPSTTSLAGKSTYGIYFSADGGQNWEKRNERVTDDGSVISVDADLSPSAPISTVVLKETTPSPSSHTPDQSVSWLSTDGGKTFPTIEFRRITSGAGQYHDSGQVYYTSKHLARLKLIAIDMPPPQISLEIFNNSGGKDWQELSIPYAPPILSEQDQGRIRTELIQVRYAPNSFFLHNTDESGDLWYSPDGIFSWQKLARNMPHILVTPYAPRTLIGFDKGKIYRLSVSQADASLTNPVGDNGVPNSIYFPSTGHNLPGLFKNYWEQHGGLAQFGYPRTEPFLEVNPSNGRIYSVQYFERNRFEYHPEYAGTPYEVELGLLGDQLTADRRTAGEAPFLQAAAKQDPDTTYFNETGHNLQGVFKQYWEQHGGLSVYGYPLSEVFDEVNPDDGQHYQVQYFERNRFEYHPNNADPQYKVLLGLLGNTLLKGKGWL